MVTSERITQIKKLHHSSQSLIAQSVAPSLGYSIALYYFLHSHHSLQSILTWMRRVQENFAVTALYLYTFFFFVLTLFSLHLSITQRLLVWTDPCYGTSGPFSCSGARWWFSSELLGKTEHWTEEEHQIFGSDRSGTTRVLQEEVLVNRSKDLSNQIPTEGSTSRKFILYLYKIK